MSWPFVPTNTTDPLSPTNNGDEDDGDSNKNLYIILGGVAMAVVLFFVAMYYILRSDRLQRQRRRLVWELQQRTSRSSNEEGSVLSRRAGFQGLSTEERAKVLGEWLKKIAFEYSAEDSDNDDIIDIEKGQSSDTAATSEDDNDDDNQSQEEENVCSICFDVYNAGDSVMTGTQCKHMFHAECAREWLLSKNINDNCPYCRVEILRPSEFRDEARETLGEARVAELLGEDAGVKEDYNKDANGSDTVDEEAASGTTESVVDSESGTE